MILFINVPFVEHKPDGIWTGPNAGSCWPHTAPGLYCYVPFPFWMASAVTYLRAHGFAADLYDAWAYRHVDELRLPAVPQIAVLEASTPTIDIVLNSAKQLKDAYGCKIVITGQHMAAYGDDVAALPYVDHVIKGEIDAPMLKIAQGSSQRVFAGESVADIDLVNGHNWVPYRDPQCLHNYLDPSMVHTPIQLQVNTSRSCPWKCSYCAWPQTSYAKYRQRSYENVLSEIYDVMQAHKIGSIFFDDETFGLGPKDRLNSLCAGLKTFGIPWSIMTRSDTWTREEMQMFIDSGCVGARFGVESFHQHLLDRVDKHLDVKKSWDNMHWLVTQQQNFHVRMLTMTSLPGETADEEQEDRDKFELLAQLGARNNNRVDIQTAVCTPLPGTKLWKQLHAAGEGGKMQDFSEFVPLPAAKSPLAERLKTYESVVKP